MTAKSAIEKRAKYLIVSVNEDGEHGIIFTTNYWDELIRRWRAYAGDGGIYRLEKL